MSMTLIRRYEVDASGVNTYTFTDIPQDYTHLLLKISARTNRGSIGEGGLLLMPSGTYTSTTLRGYNVTEAAFDSTNGYAFPCAANSTDTGTFATSQIWIPNYTSSDPKWALSEGSQPDPNGNQFSLMVSYRASYSSPITSFSLGLDQGAANKYVQYSTFSLYGILAGSDGITTVS